MKRLRGTVLTILILLLVFSRSFAQSGTSNIGTEFWTGYMDHIANPPQMSLYIAGDFTTTVTVSSADNTTFNTTVNVVPNQITIVNIPSSLFLSNLQGKNANKAIHIVSKAPVAVYAHIIFFMVSGATLLLPVNTLGTDYYSLNYTQLSNLSPSYSIFMVIGTKDSTKVEITPSQNLIDGSLAGKKFTITLQKGELYQGLSNFDLTGSLIRSVSTGTQTCNRIAVFSGSNKIRIGSPRVSSDNLYQQVYPTQSWGKNFITVPLRDRPYDIYRIAISDSTAKVTLNGTMLNFSQFTNKFYYEFTSQTTNVISSDKPIQVIQYTPTQGNSITGTFVSSDIGDPEMIYLNPIEQTIDHVTLYSAHKDSIKQSYINVLMPSARVNTFKYDGVNVASSFTTVSGNPAYSYAQLLAATGTHTLAADTGFNAIAYGFGFAESYGYSAGTNLKNLKEYIQYTNTSTKQIAPVACSAAVFNPQIVLPYITTRLIWDLGKGAKPDTVLNPIYKQFFKGTDTLYQYNYSKTVTYPAGVYPVQLTAFNPKATQCGSDEFIYLNYTSVDPPQAKVTSNVRIMGNCVGEGVQFTDQSVPFPGSKITAWLWDFGDGTTSKLQVPPPHSYASPGDKIVRLLVTIDAGCSTIGADTVHISALPVADFVVQSTPLCDSTQIKFTDKSTSAEGKIILYQWDFGDGTTSAPTDTINATHIYAATGTYKVTLIATTDRGCVSVPAQHTITVNPVPHADFAIPDVCLADYYALFAATANIADNTALTYTWNFGDAANATPSNPNTLTTASTTVQHHYSAIGTYTATLNVTAAGGCSLVAPVIKIFTVNGSSPKAAFTVTNSNKADSLHLCSNLDVLINNTSNLPGVGNGSITKAVIDFGDGSAVQTDYFPNIPTQYKHTYPAIIPTGAPVNYTVHMQVFSGTSIKCSDVKNTTITLLPAPSIQFANLNFCQNDTPTQLFVNAAGPLGTAVFTGDGIVGTQTFNPAKAGVGKHYITATYTAGNTCVATQTDTITVNSSPTASAGADFTILAGGQATIKAAASGDSLTYRWTPSAGLDHPNVLNPVASPLISTTYTLIATTNKGCPSPASTVTVTVLQAPVIPNVFTPNGDGQNDTWIIKNLDSYVDCTVQVFNRNGQLVFSSVGYGIPWDGRFSGGNLPVGTYYYIINPKHGRSTLSGPVSIIR